MKRDLYENKAKPAKELIFYGKEANLDDTDHKILLALNRDSRRSLAELSKETGLTRDVVGYRIKKLVAEGVIIGFKSVINPPLLGFSVINHVYLLLQPKTVEEEQAFVKFVKANRRVVSFLSLVGRWEYMLTIVASTPSDFNNTLKEIRMRFPDLIKDYETMSVLEEYKHEDYSGLFRE